MTLYLLQAHIKDTNVNNDSQAFKYQTYQASMDISFLNVSFDDIC